MSGVELILDRGRIHTVDGEDRTVAAVAIQGAHIVAAGPSAEVRALAGSGTHIVDLDGLTVVPGFVDGHPHMDGVGMRLLRPSFEGAKSIADIQSVVAAEAARRPAGEWLLFNPIADAPDVFGYPDRLRDGRWPTRRDLDAVAPAHPVLIRAPMMVAPGVAIVNSRALSVAGITAETRAPDGVELERDERGELTGRIREFNFPPVIERALFPTIPAPAHADWVAAIRAAMRAFNAAGVTTIYEGHGIPAPSQKAYLELWSERALTVRTYVVIAYPVPFYRDPAAGEALIRAAAQYAAGPGFGDDMLRFGGLGFSFDSATAIGACLMREPYPGARGSVWQGVQHAPDETFRTIFRQAARANLRVQVQCSGGLAIDKVLALYEEIDREIPLRGRRWVIEHCQFPSAENMATCRRLGVIPTTTTNFLWCYGSVYMRSFGRERTAASIPLKGWLEAGVPVVQSTDGHPFSPIFTYWQSLARRDGFSGETLGAANLTRREALRLYTRHAAHVAFWGDRLGSIEPGKLADLVVLSQDILEVDEDRIPETRVLATLLGGRPVHDHGLFENVGGKA
jgi:predicted amidohydrolase YtcJ